MSEKSTPSQYHIWYNNMVIESTGYLPSLAAAKKFARDRYSDPAGLKVQAAYPVLSPEKHDVVGVAK